MGIRAAELGTPNPVSQNPLQKAGYSATSLDNAQPQVQVDANLDGLTLIAEPQDV
jgi:hypothetical protein